MLMDKIAFTRKPDLEEMELLNHAIVHGVSYLTYRVLEKEVPLQVCRSGAGYYIGAMDRETREPLARDSQEYWSIKEDAIMALQMRQWTQRLEP